MCRELWHRVDLPKELAQAGFVCWLWTKKEHDGRRRHNLAESGDICETVQVTEHLIHKGKPTVVILLFADITPSLAKPGLCHRVDGDETSGMAEVQGRLGAGSGRVHVLGANQLNGIGDDHVHILLHVHVALAIVASVDLCFAVVVHS